MPGETLADRVRRLIEESGQTQEAFGATIGLDAPKFSKTLSGKRRFSSLDLARIADATGSTVDWLLTGQRAAMAARAATGSVSVSSAVREATNLAESRDSLYFLGGHQDWPKPPVFTSSLWIEQGAQLAEFALEHLGQPSAFGSSETFAGAVERAFGIDVRSMDLGTGCDGLALWTEGGAKILLVSTSKNPTRQRFTVAHELAHLLCLDDQGLHVDENVMAGSRGDASEVRANSFAACLLMPASMLSKSFTSGVSDGGFACEVMDLKVSPSSLAWRLLNLRLIDAEQRARLGGLRTIDCAAQIDRLGDYAGWVEASSQPRLPVKLIRDMFESYLRGKTTLRPLANLMGLPVELLRDAIEPASTEPGPDAVHDYEP